MQRSTLAGALTVLLLSNSPRPILADTVIERVIFRSLTDKGPILRAISDDGGLVAHTAALVHRNAAGEVQLYGSTVNVIAGPTWKTGWVQAIQNTSNGSIRLLVSQFSHVQENKGPFSRQLRSDVENAVFGQTDVLVARLPTTKHWGRDGSIRTTYFGRPGKLAIGVERRDGGCEINEIDINSGKRIAAFRVGRNAPGRWTSVASEVVLPNAISYVETGPLELCGLVKRDSTVRRIEGNAAKSLSGAWHGKGGRGRLALRPDGRALFASYRQGIACWGMDQKLLSTTTPPTSLSDGQLIAAIGNDRLLVASRGIAKSRTSELNLIDTKTNKLIANRKLPGVLLMHDKYLGPVETAAGGRFVIFHAIEHGFNFTVVFSVEDEIIRGPWYVMDPDTGTRLAPSHLRASRDAHILAVECPGHGPEALPRIIAVDLLRLVERPEL